MKKFISLILVLVVILLTFTGCATEEDIKVINYEKTMVDVSLIAENKVIFENRLSSTNEQEKFRKSIIELIEQIEKNEIKDFEVEFSEEMFTSWEECNNYAEAIEPGKTHLGTTGHYYLWLAQRIIKEEAKWEEICDKEKVLSTIAFNNSMYWVGTCTKSCGIEYKSISTQIYLHGPSAHAFKSHEQWQAFIVKVV